MVAEMFSRQPDAVGRAQLLADVNGAPVAVVYDPFARWFRLVESADEYEELTTIDGFQAIALVDPQEAR